MVKRLVIAQLNARHSVDVLDLVGLVLIKETIDILLLQEPPLALEPRFGLSWATEFIWRVGNIR